jgi:antitoxin component of MazEF toxin-antitoxin module
MSVELVVKKLGNSLGVIFPKEFIKKKRIKLKEKVFVEVVKEADITNIFGTMKADMSGQKFKNMVRDGWK